MSVSKVLGCNKYRLHSSSNREANRNDDSRGVAGIVSRLHSTIAWLEGLGLGESSRNRARLHRQSGYLLPSTTTLRRVKYFFSIVFKATQYFVCFDGLTLKNYITLFNNFLYYFNHLFHFLWNPYIYNVLFNCVIILLPIFIVKHEILIFCVLKSMHTHTFYL